MSKRMDLTKCQIIPELNRETVKIIDEHCLVYAVVYILETRRPTFECHGNAGKITDKLTTASIIPKRHLIRITKLNLTFLLQLKDKKPYTRNDR